MAVKPVPEGYQTLSPYLAVEDADRAIDYYKKAFGAKERVRMEAPGGAVGHAELEVGDSGWWLATQVEDVPPEEMAERATAAMADMGG